MQSDEPSHKTHKGSSINVGREWPDDMDVQPVIVDFTAKWDNDKKSKKLVVKLFIPFRWRWIAIFTAGVVMLGTVIVVLAMM